MPIRLYQFKDRIEIMNAGGLYGQARPENFPEVNDYRNPVIAEGMKNLKYVNMFNRGIDRVQTVLKENGNEPAIFDVEKMTVFEVTVIELRDENFPDNKSAQVTDQVSDQVSDQVTDQVSNQVKELVNILEDDMTRVQLMDMLGIKSVPYFRKKYIQKSVELGVIELTQPNSPNSPTQKYRLTEKGKQIKINLNNLEKK
jgi:ATP-dependent DNA helicase RecG